MKNNEQATNIKFGEYMLTPLETFIINRKMPEGFKLEKEEKINNSKNLESKKDLKNNKNSESYNIMMKCYDGFNKIKSNPYSKFFYTSTIPDKPSLSLIEKNIINLEYKTIDDFISDLRKLWNYLFKNHAKEPNIYQNICKMSLFSEQICKELKEEKDETKKRTKRIKKDLNEINNNNNSSSNRSTSEIHSLGNLIRTLNKKQLKGLIPILSDKKENKNIKTFEFDIEQISSEKYNELKNYVENCLNKKIKGNNNKVQINEKNEI